MHILKCVELQNFEIYLGQRLIATARLSCAIAVTLVAAVGKFLTAARERYKIYIYIYSTYPISNTK